MLVPKMTNVIIRMVKRLKRVFSFMSFYPIARAAVDSENYIINRANPFGGS